MWIYSFEVTSVILSFEEKALPFQLPFLRELTFCLVVQKKSFKQLVLDGNLVSGGVGEDVFMADIVQAWHREGKETVKLTQEKGGTRLRRNTMPGLVSRWDEPGTITLSFYNPS